MNKKQEILKIFSLHIRNILQKLQLDIEKLQEVRLRIDCPLLIIWDGQEFFVGEDGKISNDPLDGERITRKDLEETVSYMADYSLYAFEEEMRQGFLTIQGGHRIGMAGKIVMDGQKIQSIRYISFLNVRFSHQICGCADEVIPYVIKGQEVCHTMIISPPRCGKTTLLRDLIRQISNGTDSFAGCTVGVVDERSELGGSYLGVPQNDLGIRTDVLDCCPKAEGMMMLIRSMSPAVIAVDEIGGKNDIEAIEAVLHCGCKLLATVHGNSIDDVRKRPLLQKLVQDRVFERYVVLKNLKNKGKIHQIFNERGSNIFDSRKIQKC